MAENAELAVSVGNDVTTGVVCSVRSFGKGMGSALGAAVVGVYSFEKRPT